MSKSSNFFKNTDELPTALCPAPWTQVAISTEGKLGSCCLMDQKSDISFTEFWNSSFSKELRETMLQGEWHSQCKKCHLEEEYGGLSKRDYEKSLLRQANETQSLLDYELNGIQKKSPLTLEIRFGNLCNLKCRMCSPKNSSKIASEYLKFNNVHLFPQLKNVKERSTLDDYKTKIPPFESLRILR